MIETAQTLVIQSYRRVGVPAWLRRCMDSVSDWARQSGFAYEFVDDSLFALLPDWFRERCGDQLLPQTDLARLMLMRERLRRGVPRVIWLDADIFVFAPQHLQIASARSFSFCDEVWLHRKPDGSAFAVRKVNNAAMTMDAENPLLEFYIHACLTIAAERTRGAIGKLDFGTHLLTQLTQVLPLSVIRSVGIVSPLLGLEIAAGSGTLCAMFAQTNGHAIGAANLCASLVGSAAEGVVYDEFVLSRAMDRLEQTHGEVINRHLAS